MTEQTPFLITVDVEGVVDSDSYRSVDILDRMLSDLWLPATLFVTPDVIQERTSTLRRWIADGHTVGLHIHPERLGGDDVWLGQYHQDAIESFLRQGVDVFKSNLGHHPRFFRAGRWSFSDELLRALGQTGFEYDASSRPTTQRNPYCSHGVVELPLSVYGPWFFPRKIIPGNVEMLPLSIDAFLQTLPRRFICYGTTWRILASDPSYLMVGFHDYDLTRSQLRRSIERYTARVSEFTNPVSLEDVKIAPEEEK